MRDAARACFVAADKVPSDDAMLVYRDHDARVRRLSLVARAIGAERTGDEPASTRARAAGASDRGGSEALAGDRRVPRGAVNNATRVELLKEEGETIVAGRRRVDAPSWKWTS